MVAALISMHICVGCIHHFLLPGKDVFLTSECTSCVGQECAVII